MLKNQSKRNYQAYSKIKNLILLTCLSQFYSATADELTIGLGTHFGFGWNYIDELSSYVKNESIRSFRDEMYWKDIEPVEGSMSIQGRALKTMDAIGRLEKQGVKPLLILSYGNPVYDGGSQPFTDTGRIAFANYAQYVTQQTKAPLVEVWNEWNIGGGAKPNLPTGSVDDYVKLTDAVYTKLKASQPRTKILAGALGDDFPDWKWTKEAINKGLLRVSDGLSVHLYNYSMSRAKGSAEEFIRRLDSLTELTKLENHGQPFPIYITEVGWPNHVGIKRISEEQASRDSAVFILLAKSRPNLKGIWFYEFRDSGTDPLNKEHHFGLVNLKNEEKPVSCTVKTYARLLSQATFIRDFYDKNGTKYVIYRNPDETQLIAVWRTISSSFELNTGKSVISSSKAFLEKYQTGCPAHLSTKAKPTAETGYKYLIEASENPIIFTTPKGAVINVIN